tara:strand:- start:1 stop:1335 length:1335 start_codon:yes stop_codon:yes gene_type:complete
MNTDELMKLVGEAYVFGYPLVIMDMTKNVGTNIERPHPVKGNAPINQLGHYRKFPDHTMKTVVKPNVDTYYSIAWLDLAAEPQMLFMPATDRYYLLPFYDAYTNVFASPGTRTTGTEAQEFVIAGPNWEGEIPEGTQLIEAPTEMVWMIGRIQVNSVEDGATTVKAIQDEMKLLPLSAYGNNEYEQPKGSVAKENENIIPSKAVRDLDVNTYLNRVAQLMVKNPPQSADSAILKKLAQIGLISGKPFSLETDNIIVKTKLKALPNFIHKKMEATRDNPDASIMTNGWRVIREGLGTYGIDYMKRAYVDFVGLGANWVEDAVYPTCVFDLNGNPLEASNRYQLHFEANELPPVQAFWSITSYNADEFLVENEMNRFALGDRDPIQYNEDGSLDFYIQTKAPRKEQISNWLPIPEQGRFTLTMRLYWPKEEVLNGSWNPPFLIPIE